MRADASPSEPASSARSDHRSRTYLLLYALAYAGGVIAYVPFLVFLLPTRVEALVEGGERIALLSQITFWGAVAASVANLCAGSLSDWSRRRGGGRRPWLVAGLIATLLSYAALQFAGTPAQLMARVLAFQVALNFLLAPLAAVAADEVPDAQKGVLGGLLGVAHPAGHLIGALVAAAAGLEWNSRLTFTGALVALAVLPFLAATRRGASVRGDGATERPASRRTDLVPVWAARFLVQIAGAVMFSYLLFYFGGVRIGGAVASASELAPRVARLSGVAMALAAAAALAAGWASDRSGSRRPFLAASAWAAAAGLAVLALRPTWTSAAIGYGVFTCGISVFVALSSTFAMQLLPSPENRGRDLGWVNLTNTLPSMAAPALAYAAIGIGGFKLLLLGLAASTAAAGGLVLLRGRAP